MAWSTTGAQQRCVDVECSDHNSPRLPERKIGSNHVRFNNKVHVSPTPPDSDANTSEFAHFFGVEPKLNRTQLDGPNDDIDNGEESRGRHSYHGTPARPSSEMRSRKRNSPTRNSPKRRESSSPDSPNIWVGGARRLARALSESPSREELSVQRKKHA